MWRISVHLWGLTEWTGKAGSLTKTWPGNKTGAVQISPSLQLVLKKSHHKWQTDHNSSQPASSLCTRHWRQHTSLQQAEMYDGKLQHLIRIVRHEQSTGLKAGIKTLHLHKSWKSYLDILCKFWVSLQFLFIWCPPLSSLTARKGLDKETLEQFVIPAFVVTELLTEFYTEPVAPSNSHITHALSLSPPPPTSLSLGWAIYVHSLHFSQI